MDHYEVVRRQGNNPSQVIAEVDAGTTEYTDEATEPGDTYTYVVRAHNDAGFDRCGKATATAIPFFGAPAVAVLAAVGGVGVYAALRRRA